MSGENERIPESFIRDLEAKRRRLVDAQEENGVNLDALVDFLYPDTAHLVFELLQNAEDAAAKTARFELSDTQLSFTHDGRPFSEEDLDNITNYFKSAKYEREDKIGRFGIGFKSVFACTESPRIYSPTVAFEIVDRIVPTAIPRPAASIPPCAGETVIELPFNGKMSSADRVRKEIRLGLEGMPTMSVLHLKNIEVVEWRTDAGDSGWMRRVELEDGVVRIDVKRPTGPESRFFLRFREPYTEGSSMHLDVVFELEEKEQRPFEELAVAPADRFRVVPARTGRVAVFFPATKETSNLRFHLHAPFIPELSRASIKKHDDNVALIGRLAALAAKSLETIRDLGLLDREFLGVLPNSRDPLPEAYRVFQEAIVRAMREQPLVPMQSGGHERADRLLQGRREFKDFLGVDDIRFLMSGWDYDMPSLRDWSPRTNRSAVPSSTHRGWAVSATQKNTEVDRLLSDLALTPFKVEHLVPPDSQKAGETKKWLSTHDAAWHRSYYASVDKHWDALRPAHNRLRKLPMVRTRSGEYRRGDECRFANDGDDAPEGVAIADPDTYSGGKGAKEAEKGIERLGVREIDDASKAVGILDKYYGETDNRPSWDQHRSHIEQFIQLLGSEKVAAATFHGYRFLLDSVEDWEPPHNLYAGNGYAPSCAAPYYRSLARLRERERRQCPVRYELHGRYRDIRGFDQFARQIGVAYEIPIQRSPCERNPQYEHLVSGGGQRWRDTGKDDDWHVPGLERMLQLLQSTKGRKAERVDLARAIWTALDRTERHIQLLEARFKMNRSAETRTAPSQLVATLRKAVWVPQDQGEDDLVFVKPRQARPERLPGGFAFDSGWAWIKATGFGEAQREQARQVAEEKLDQEAKASERTAMAKGLGFASSEEAEFFAGLPEKMKKEVRARFESMTRSGSDFDRPPNPDRRRKMARRRAEAAPKRTARRVERIIVEEEDQLKAEARTELRAHYEQRAHLSLCQVSGCEDRSFKLKDGVWYFEAVRFLDLDRMVAADYVALCPRHARMFRHANESDGLKQRVATACAAGDHAEGITIPVVLAGENVSIRLAPKHAIDLVAALEVDGDEQAG